MAIITDTLMTGPAMQQIKYADNDGDVFERMSHVYAVAYNLTRHRHIPGEGNLIPLEGLDAGSMKRLWFFASLGGS